MDIKSIKRIGVLPQDPKNVYKIGIDAEDINNDNNIILTTKMQTLSKEQKAQVKLNLDIKEQQKEQILNYVTPEQFEAKGDGKTDDSNAFKQALETGRKVICDSTKTYYFKEPIDVRTLQTGHLDGNNAHFINFHIYIDMTDDLTDWRHKNNESPNYGNPQFPIFTIENMNFKPEEYWGKGRPKGWETPLIISGAPMRISNIATTYPYILSTPDRYIDYMQFERWNFCADPAAWVDIDLDLNAISCCCPRDLRDGGQPVFQNFVYDNTWDSDGNKVQQGTAWSAGDSWRFQQCSEFSLLNHPEYNFMTVSRRQPLIVESCIQTSFKVDKGAQVIFQGCHWESKSNVTFVDNLSGSSIQFNECYFYCNHVLNDTFFTTYNQCKFAAGPYINSHILVEKPPIPLARLTNNKSFYDLKCRLIDCNFGDNNVLNTEYMRLSKSLPKKTYNNNCVHSKVPNRIQQSEFKAEQIFSYSNCYFKSDGEYIYRFYVRATSDDNIALCTQERRVTITDTANKQYRVGQKFWDVNGGCSLYIIRIKDNIKEYTEFYANPSTFNDLNERMNFMFYDYGTCNRFTIEKEDYTLKNETIYKNTVMPWIPLTQEPDFTINANLFEANGILVELNELNAQDNKNGLIQLQSNFADKINLNEIYFGDSGNSTARLGKAILGTMILGQE